MSRSERGVRRQPWCSEAGELRYIRTRFNRRERAEARRHLRRGDEPYPHRPRGRAKYDMW